MTDLTCVSRNFIIFLFENDIQTTGHSERRLGECTDSVRRLKERRIKMYAECKTSRTKINKFLADNRFPRARTVPSDTLIVR